MKLREGDARPGGLADSLLLAPASPLAAIAGFIRKTLAIAELEIRKLRHDFTELITRAIQPALWLLLFGQVITKARIMPTGEHSLSRFYDPGHFGPKRFVHRHLLRGGPYLGARPGDHEQVSCQPYPTRRPGVG